MLITLVRRFLAPYRGPLAVVVALQFIGTVAALYLPSLNADIIDNGVVTGDTGYIVRIGAVMLGVALRADRLLGRRGLVRRAYGDGLRPRRPGRDLPPGRHRSRQREVQHFGAPSLITRETNDVQQVQMLVLMSCTLMVMAPIMMVGGIVMAIREDLGLSWLVAVDGAGAGRRARASSSPGWCPSFRLMQARIDEVNRLLREQITGVRVVRAFVREPLETERFAAANADLTAVAIRAGRWLAADVPDRDAGRERRVRRRAVVRRPPGRRPAQMQVGALTAYLAYLMQILMSVMMGTFMMMMIPRSAVCADRIMEVLAHRRPSVPRPTSPSPTCPQRGTLRLRRRRVQLPGRRRAGAARRVLRGPSPARPSRSSARPAPARPPWSTWCRGCSTSPAARVAGRRRRRTPTSSRSVLWSRDRAGAAEGVPVLRHRRGPTCCHGKPDATDEELWAGAARSPRPTTSSRAMPEGLDAPIAQGGTNVSGGQRQRLAIARAVDTPARDLPVRRLVLGARPGHRRPAARGAAAGHPRRDRR